MNKKNPLHITILLSVFIITLGLQGCNNTPTVVLQSGQITATTAEGTVVAPATGLPADDVPPIDPTDLIQTQEAALNRNNQPGPTLAPGNSPDTSTPKPPVVCGSVGMVLGISVFFILIIRKKRRIVNPN